jgi:hypothetical protein
MRDPRRDELDRLLAEGKRVEAGKLPSLISFESRRGVGERPVSRAEDAERRRKIDEELSKDPDYEQYRGPRGISWRRTRKSMLDYRMYASLVEQDAQEAAQEAYKRTRQDGASFWLEVAEQELAEAVANNADLLELALLKMQVNKLTHMAKARPKPTPDRVREQTRERVRRYRARRAEGRA